MGRGRTLNLTPQEQGKRWRAAGGELGKCWYPEQSPEYRLFARGWREEDERLLAIASEHKDSS